MNNKISIAMATYNGERFLREQLDSLYNQTVEPYEVVISDDCSKDSTLKIAQEYQNRLNIKILSHTKNQGVNKNFEFAIRACAGDYIMICDQDDIWLPEKVKVLYENILEVEEQIGSHSPILVSSESISFSDSKEINLELRPCNGIISEQKDFIYNKYLYCQGCTMIFNKAFVAALPSMPEDFKAFPYDAFIAMIGIFNGQRRHILQSLMYDRNHDANVVGKKYIDQPFCERVRNRLLTMTYDFYEIPYFRQKLYYSIYTNETYKKQFIINKDIHIIAHYYHASIFRKVILICKTTKKDIYTRCIQFTKFIVSLPIRLFLKPDVD